MDSCKSRISERTSHASKVGGPKRYEEYYKTPVRNTVEDKENQYFIKGQFQQTHFYSKNVVTGSGSEKISGRFSENPRKGYIYQKDVITEKSDYKALSQGFDHEESPILMCNASKPSKKMPSYKPLPKLMANLNGDSKEVVSARLYSTQDELPPLLSVPSRETQRTYEDSSKKRMPFEEKTDIQGTMNTCQQNYDHLSRPKRFEYMESPEYRYAPEDLDRSDSSISSIFLAPSKGAKKNMDRLVKIKEKILKPLGDHSHDVDYSSMTHYSRSMTNGDGQFKDSVASLSVDNDEDDMEDFNNASQEISREIVVNSSQKISDDLSKKSLASENSNSGERFEYKQVNEEIKLPQEEVIESRQNMINLENIILIEK